LIKKKIEGYPRRWHKVLSEAIWAPRISKHGATKVTPFELVSGQEAMLPVEENLQILRVVAQDNLLVEDYGNLMMDRVDEALESRLQALREIEKEKLQVAKAYNKKVQENHLK
jgi:hypothetical protein